MADNSKQRNTSPFPIEKYAHLEVTEDGYIIDDNTIIGKMDTPFPTADYDISNEDIVKFMKQGIKVDGYYEYQLNDKGIPVKKVNNVPGYLEGGVTMDLNGYLYYSNVCIGTWGDKIYPIINTEYLDEHGIEYSYKYKAFEPAPVVEQPAEICVVPYKNQMYREVNHNLIVKVGKDNNIICIGYLLNDEIVPLTDELKKYCKKMNILPE